MIQKYDRVRETMLSHTLPNGLRVCFVPKEGFSKTFALLATDFGSVDAHFTLEDGTRVCVPAGIAHFLEHKMFENEDGNTLQKFAATGAAPNAFTSHNMTAYHFSCTERFEENLEILLKTVFTPYFTDENVEKEKGIIGQEIGMMDDQPFWQAYTGMYQGLYHEHPVRIPIAGSVESIAGITPGLLLQCYEAFYTPANMALVVCGGADFDAVLALAERFSPAGKKRLPARDYGARRETVCQSVVGKRMAVSQPYFIVGLKDEAVQSGESALRRQLLGELCCRILAGETSPLYAELYRERLITRQFDSGYSLHPGAACAYFVGSGRDPAAVRDKLVQRAQAFARDGVPAELFGRAKRAAYGMTLRTLDQPDEICRAQCEFLFRGEDFLRFPEVCDTIGAEDVQAALARWAQPGRVTLSRIDPLEEG